MPKLIKNGRIVDDHWPVARLAEGQTAQDFPLPAAAALLPLTVWQARRQEILATGKEIGIWLESSEEPETIADDLEHFAIIGVDFPRFTDGRAYSTARLLRERYGYRGEIRAIGDVLRDQLFFMKRCGFDAYALREDKDITAALDALDDFSESYQACVAPPQPLFRRRAVSP